MEDDHDEPNSGGSGAPASVGEQLRAAREAQGFPIADVAERTRIPIRHLAMIESGELEALPAPTYSVGFVKTYARLLGLDQQALAGQFRRQLAHAAPREAMISPYEPADPARTPSRALAWTCFAIAVLLIAGYLYWRGVTAENGVTLAAQTRDHPAAPAIVAAPPPAAAASPPPVAGVDSAALLTATGPVWIKVYEYGGATLFMGILQPGEHFAVPPGAADPRLLTSRPNVLDVTVGASRIPTLGPAERRIKDVSLKPAALLARVTPAAPPAPAATPVENSAAPL